MNYTPQKNKKAHRLSLLFVITGFVLMALSSILPYRALFQLISVVLIIAGVQLLVRFVLSDYRYIIDDRDNGTSDLIVCKKQGKNDVKVCHVTLSCIEDVYKRVKGGNNNDRGSQIDRRYNYAQNLSADAYVVAFRDGEKRIEVILECDAAFVNAIRDRIGNADGDETSKTFAM